MTLSPIQAAKRAPRKMDLWQATAVCGWYKYSDFGGRASRRELWWWQVLIHLVNLVLAVVDTALMTEDVIRWGPLGWTLGIVIFVPGMAVTVRRLHDIGKSGWWQAVWLGCGVIALATIAVGLMLALGNVGNDLADLGEATASELQPLFIGGAFGLAILLATTVWYVVWMVRPGDEAENRYGPAPAPTG